MTAATLPGSPVCVVAGFFCDCPTPAPPAQVMTGLSLLLEEDDARVWVGHEVEHPCDGSMDRAYLVCSPVGPDVWLVGDDATMSAFNGLGGAADFARIDRLHAALLDLGPWFALADADADQGAPSPAAL